MRPFVGVMLGLAGGVALLVVLLLVRTRSLGLRVGSFECALRRAGRTSWASGFAAYGADRLEWYRVLSASPRPERAWPRNGLEVLATAVRLHDGRPTTVMELSCRSGAEVFTLAMSYQAASGLTSWLEAAPPGGRMTLR